ncbi:MAG: hypothetical protein O9305_13800 [Rhodobacteraceae bacterium]|nr:hypothetical protein [Paracoccaceae bacterium]
MMGSDGNTKGARNRLALSAQQGDAWGCRELVDPVTGLVGIFALTGRARSGGVADLEDITADAWISAVRQGVVNAGLNGVIASAKKTRDLKDPVGACYNNVLSIGQSA